MGRRKTVDIERRHSPRRRDDLKQSHRVADTKYRSTMQHLFQLLKEELFETTTKDYLLTNTLLKIQSSEDAISEATGSVDALNAMKSEFSLLLLEDEAVWKKEKNVEFWWINMQNRFETLALYTGSENKPDNSSSCRNALPNLEMNVLPNLEESICNNEMKNFIERFNSRCKELETVGVVQEQDKCFYNNQESNSFKENESHKYNCRLMEDEQFLAPEFLTSNAIVPQSSVHENDPASYYAFNNEYTKSF